MSASRAALAMGKHDGDYIKLENQWARVVIERQDNGNGCVEFSVTGDLACLRSTRKVFFTAAAALAYALKSLAEYEQGALR